jgi:hypothetical protein
MAPQMAGTRARQSFAGTVSPSFPTRFNDKFPLCVHRTPTRVRLLPMMGFTPIMALNTAEGWGRVQRGSRSKWNIRSGLTGADRVGRGDGKGDVNEGSILLGSHAFGIKYNVINQWQCLPLSEHTWRAEALAGGPELLGQCPPRGTVLMEQECVGARHEGPGSCGS